ncbi:MAG: hypothetical protein R3C68_03620 [Myxococcota bacterium]
MTACTQKNHLQANKWDEGRRSPLDATVIDSDANMRRRILSATLQNSIERLGPLRFTAKSRFKFSRAGDHYEQEDTYDVRQDAGGNFYVALNAADKKVELYQVGQEIFIRQDRGPMPQTEARCGDRSLG